MPTQVARIGGQLLQDNLLRELADLKFDNDLLVVKRDNTLGVNTTTTPRNLTVDGTLRASSGTSEPDVIFNNSLKVGDFTLATTGISTGTGDVTLQSTHPEGYIVTNGIGSYNFAIRDDGLKAIVTNGDVGIKSEVFDGQTEAWNSNGNYGNYWDPGPKISADSPPNDMDRLYDYTLSLSQSGLWNAEELAALDWDGDGDIQADDALQLLQLNTQFIGGTAFPASNLISEHSNPEAFKAYIEKYYPRSAPRRLQLQTGDTLTVNGNLHATGNITYGGETITVGDDSTDTASFFAEFNNDLTPDQDNVFHIGKDNDSTGPAKGFRIAVDELKADSVAASGIVFRGIELTKDVGIIFVSNGNGSDTNEGNNPGGPYATIEKALSVATSGDLIYIYPGTYQEDFPLTVPKGVTIQGDSIRGVEILPTSATQSNDCFLVNSDVTIENLTVKEFYYNSSNDTGYAFRFAEDFSTTIFEQEPGRSPYIRNVSVITKGSTISASDPRGFASGDAGKGALVDGSVVAQNSRSASMLFHSVTFITPGVDALTARSGVRVEWLNSFSYFADRGINLQQGTGRLLPDSTTEYGCELRCIASAAVYGNKGIEADGANCIAYLINHNFAYIGAGKDVTNDNTLTNQDNEVVETNNATVYYTSQDQRGNFRVGDNFLVDLENERTSFDVESIFADNTRVQIRQGNDVVTLEPGQITLSNIVIAGNNIETTTSNIDFDAAGSINFQSDVVAPNLSLTGNITVGGAINAIGDSPTDIVDLNTFISQDFMPGDSDGLTLGSKTKTWANLYSITSAIDTVTISSESIGTNETNADLYILNNGTGTTNFENLQIKENKIIGKFDPEGEFIVYNSTDPGYPSIFNSYTELRSVLPKWTTVLGIPVLGTELASEDAVKHAANLLGSYLDNNYDGVADNATLYAEFSDGLTGIIVYADSTDENNLTSTLGSFKPNRSFGVLENEMNNFQEDGGSSQRNLVQEKILKDLLIPKWCSLYTPLSTTRRSTITEAMDAARGGFQAGGQPGYNYPPFAWYTDPLGLSYENLVYEYLYYLISSQAGTNEWRAGSITSVWDLYNTGLLQSQDAAGYSIITNATYNFPIINSPSIDYWTQVTNNLGGTPRDVVFAPTENLDFSATGMLTLPKGNAVQRPSVSAGIRYNTEFDTFEGVETGGSVSLSGIYDTDRDTYLDLSNNQFNFVTGGVNNHTLNGILLESGGFSSNHQFSIDGNVVSADDTDGNSILRSNGTGYTKIEDLHFQDSDLLNSVSQVFSFSLTNSNRQAYLKIDNPSGMVIPQGNTAERPSTPEIGHTRYNTQLEYVEAWNGTSWINAAGEVESIEASDVEELAYIFNLILD